MHKKSKTQIERRTGKIFERGLSWQKRTNNRRKSKKTQTDGEQAGCHPPASFPKQGPGPTALHGGVPLYFPAENEAGRRTRRGQPGLSPRGDAREDARQLTGSTFKALRHLKVLLASGRKRVLPSAQLQGPLAQGYAKAIASA